MGNAVLSCFHMIANAALMVPPVYLNRLLRQHNALFAVKSIGLSGHPAGQALRLRICPIVLRGAGHINQPWRKGPKEHMLIHRKKLLLIVIVPVILAKPIGNINIIDIIILLFILTRLVIPIFELINSLILSPIKNTIIIVKRII